MAAAVRLRSDFDGTASRRLARASRDAKQVRRLLAVAAIYDGERRSEAARIGQCFADLTALAQVGQHGEAGRA